MKVFVEGFKRWFSLRADEIGSNRATPGTPETILTPEEGYESSVYVASLKEPVKFRPQLQASTEADVCVVGGGYAGLCTALSLAEKGRTVVLLEQGRIGAGASGVNGGFAIAGFALECDGLLDAVGHETASNLYKLSLMGLRLLRQRVTMYHIQCDLANVGWVTASLYPSRKKLAEQGLSEFNKLCSSNFEFWDKKRLDTVCKAKGYSFGIFDRDGCVVNPLGLVFGLARACEMQGVRIFERTKAAHITETLPTEHTLVAASVTQSAGPTLLPADALAQNRHDRTHRRWTVHVGDKDSGVVVLADDVVLAGGPLMSDSFPVAKSMVSMNTYLMATEPLGARASEVLSDTLAVNDDRNVLNYYRLLNDGRLLWGGVTTARPLSKENAKAKLLSDLEATFPQLKGVKVDYVWGGQMAYASHMMPLIGQHKPHLWYCTGFGGHGVVPTHAAGEIIASAIVSGGVDDRWKMFCKNFPAGYAGYPFRSAAVGASIYWFRLQDWLDNFLERFRSD